MEKGRKTVSSNRRNNGGDTGGGGGGNTSTEKTNDLKNGESFEGPSKRKSKSQSLIVSRGSKSKVEDPEVAASMKRQTKKRTQDLMRMEANDQMSCVNAEAKRRTRTKRTAAGIVPEEDEAFIAEQIGGRHNNDEKHALANHLRSIAPFNKRWKVTQTINEGTYGVVFAVQDVETGVHGVIKVAKSVGNDAGNQTAEWEGFILEKMYKQNPKGSVVRLLDKGMLADQNGEGMEFMVLEKAEIPVMDYVKGAKGLERKWRVSNVMLQMLKGIHDMHVQGLLHRDLKPDNMGILAKKQPIVVLFDLGMVRMYTGFFGEHRQPRTTCAFRGTPEWASGYAQKGRDQNRFDDLIGWLYVAVELFDETENPMQPLPWTFRQNPKIVKFLKSPFCPAYLLLRRCPPQFYAINTYLMTASRKTTPDYHFIANKVLETIADLENQMSKLPSSITTSSAAAGDNEKEKSKITGGGGDGGRPAAIRNIGTAGTTTGTGTTGGPSINEQQKKSILKVSSDDQKKKSKSEEFKQNNNNNTKEATKTKEQPSKEQKAVEEKKKSLQSDKSAIPENGGEKSGDKKAENKESLEKKDKSGNALPTKSRKSTASKNEIK